MVMSGLCQVAMVQRSPTAFVIEAYGRTLFDQGYNEHSDRAAHPMQSPVNRVLGMAEIQVLATQHEAWFDKLEGAGLKVDRYPDLQHLFYEVIPNHGLRFPGSSWLTCGNRCRVATTLTTSQ